MNFANIPAGNPLQTYEEINQPSFFVFMSKPSLFIAGTIVMVLTTMAFSFEDEKITALHTSKFKANEEALEIATSLLSEICASLL